MMRARVTVYPRPEILDPQGKAIHQALLRVGFAAVERVRAGKSFDVDLAAATEAEARAMLDQMCKTLLSNTVVEDYSIELTSKEGP